MNDATESILAAIGEMRTASAEQHKQTHAAVERVASDQVEMRGEMKSLSTRLGSLEQRVSSHDRKIDRATDGVRAVSEADLKHESDLAATAVAYSAMASRLEAVEGVLANVPRDTAKAVATEATKASSKAAGEVADAAKTIAAESKKITRRVALHPLTQAAAMFLGTAGGALLYSFVQSLMHGGK